MRIIIETADGAPAITHAETAAPVGAPQSGGGAPDHLSANVTDLAGGAVNDGGEAPPQKKK